MPKTIEDILRNEPHILQIIPAQKQTEYAVDYTAFIPTQKRDVEFVIRVLTDYLKSPSIVDDFKDHDERRIWRDIMRQKYGKEFGTYYDENNLRMNNTATISLNLEYFFRKRQPYTGYNKETFYQLTENVINACHPKGGYAAQTTPEKLDIVAKIKQEIQALLDFLPKQTRATGA